LIKYRKAGIPTAGIFDLDVLNNQDLKRTNMTVFRKILNGFNVPNDIIDTLEEEQLIL